MSIEHPQLMPTEVCRCCYLKDIHDHKREKEDSNCEEDILSLERLIR
jgi:hypothetical protein